MSREDDAPQHYASDVIRELRTLGDKDGGGGGLCWDKDEAESRLAMGALQCQKCGDGPHKTMPKLWEHVGRCKAPPKGETL